MAYKTVIRLLLRWQVVCAIAAVCAAMKRQVPKPDSMSYEDVLTKYVMDAYKSRSKHARPVLQFNDTLTVEFAIQLTQIVSLNEQEQVLTLNVWDQYLWKDYHIGWDPQSMGTSRASRFLPKRFGPLI